MDIEKISHLVIGCAIKVHKELGPGLLESAYKECTFYEINKQGLYVQKEVPMPIVYEEIQLDHGYRIDLLVENSLVLELKTVEAISYVHIAQILTYMRLGGFDLGLLINFNVPRLKLGIKRIKL